MTQTLRWGRVSQDGTYKTPEKIASGKDTCMIVRAASRRMKQNVAGTCRITWHRFDTQESAIVHALVTKNPGTLAGVTGSRLGLDYGAEAYITKLIPASVGFDHV